MRIFRCDRCGKEMAFHEAPITIKGYYPKNFGGILLVEAHHEHHFCHRDCFLAWMNDGDEMRQIAKSEK